jgi:phage antirepressor YoqD-like protein
MANKYIQEKIQEAVKCFNTDKDILIKDCAERYGIKAATLTKHLHAAGVYELRTNKKHKKDGEEFVNFYLKNKNELSPIKCAKIFGLSKTTAYKYLKEHNVNLDKTDEWEKEREKARAAIPEYEANELMSVRECAEKYNVTPHVLNKVLKQAGVKLHENVLVKTKMGTSYVGGVKTYKYEPHTLNESFFKAIDTEEKAYWLGFITADGSVFMHGDSSVLAIALAIRDYDQLHRLKKALSATHPIYERKQHLSTLDKRYEICGLHMVLHGMEHDLMSHNVFPNKQTNEKPSSNIPDEYVKAYIRGFFDGDGWVSRYTRNTEGYRRRWEIGIGSSLEMVKYIREKVLQEVGMTFDAPYSNGAIFNITTVDKTKIYKILKWLYGDTEYYLPRKYEKALEFCRLHSTVMEECR